jgi:imidazolonepropionase-like amidohydrolase
MMAQIVLRGKLFDGEHVVDDGTVVVDEESGKVADAGTRQDVEIPKGAKVVMPEGVTILPGFVDAHMHFFGTGTYGLADWVVIPDTLTALRAVPDMRRMLSGGFTAVRDLGSKAGTFISRAEREGLIEGPRVISAAKSLAQTGGDDDLTILPLDISQRLSYTYYCDGPWECRKAVRMCLRDGAEVIKVYASGSFAQGKKARVQLTLEELKAIVDEAHRAGVKVAAHAYGEAALSNVIEAGVDSIEHGIGLTDEIAAQAKKKGIFYVPTLAAFFAAKPSTNVERETFIKRHLTEDMRIAKEQGLRLVNGTDFVGSEDEPLGQNYREVVNLARFFGAEAALTAATSTAMECLGLEGGRLAAGAPADVVVVRGDPTMKPEHLAPENVLLVMKGGKVFKAP